MAKDTRSVGQRERVAGQQLDEAFADLREKDRVIGLTGRGDTGRTVLVPQRPGFIYVRIPKKVVTGTLEEFTEMQAFSTAEFRHGVPVVLRPDEDNPSRHVVEDLWKAGVGEALIESILTPIPPHRRSHELYTGEGHDPLMLDTIQLRNLQVTPTVPASTNVRRGSGWLPQADGTISFYDAVDVSLAAHFPTGTLGATYVSLWMDVSDGSMVQTTRSHIEAPGLALGADELLVWPTTSGYFPCAAVRLGADMTVVKWEHNDKPNIVDMRPHMSLLALDDVHALDPSAGHHTGTLSASSVAVADAVGWYDSGTLEGVLEEIGYGVGVGGGTVELQEDDVKALDADTINFEGDGAYVDLGVIDEGGNKGTVTGTFDETALDHRFVNAAGGDKMEGQLLVEGISDETQLVVRGPSGQSEPLVLVQSPLGATLVSVAAGGDTDIEGHLAVGSEAAVGTTEVIKAWGKFTSTTDNHDAVEATVELDPSGPHSGTNHAIYGFAATASGNAQNLTSANGGLIGVEGTVYHQGTGILSVGTVFRARVQNVNAGTITDAYAMLLRSATAGGGAITNNYGLYVEGQTAGGTLNYAIYTNAGLVRFGDGVTIVGSDPAVRTLHITGADNQVADLIAVYDYDNNQLFDYGSTGILELNYFDGQISNEAQILTLAHRTSATPVAGFGLKVQFVADSATVDERVQGEIATEWATPTDASRKARLILRAHDTAAREGMRIEADGSRALTSIGGSAVQTDTTLYINQTFTDPTGESRILNVQHDFQITGNNAQIGRAILGTVQTNANAFNYTNGVGLIAIQGATKHGGSGVVTEATGVSGRIVNQSSGDITLAQVFNARLRNQGSGDITAGYNILIEEGENIGGGNITTQYGVYIESLVVGGTNYAIYTNAGYSRFGDNIATKDASVNAYRAINVLWNTTETSNWTHGLYVENSAQPASASTATYRGITGVSSAEVAGNYVAGATLEGVSASAVHSTAGQSLGKAWGTVSQIVNEDTGTIVEGVNFLAATTLSSTGAITTNYGLLVYTPSVGSGSITTNYGIYIQDQNTAGTDYAIYTNAGHVRFGDHLSVGTASPSAVKIVNLAQTWTDVVDQIHYGIDTQVVGDPTGATDGRFIGVHGVADTDSSNAQNMTRSDEPALQGGRFVAYWRGTGTLTKGTALWVKNRQLHASGTITSQYGIYISASTTAGTVGTNYGLYIENQNQASADYAIYTNAGNILFNAGYDAGTDFTVRSDNYDALFVDGGNDSIDIMHHASGKIGFYAAAPVTKQTISTARDDPEGALKDLLTALDALGLITDSSTVS